jgi:hypothetical protein
MNTLTKRLITSAAVAAGMGLSMQTQAGAIAYSYLEVDDFTLSNANTGTQLDVTDFSFLNIGDSSSASTVINLGTVMDEADATASGNTTDTLLACAGNCAGIAENDPTQQGTSNFGRGDTFGDGSLISGVGGGTDGADVWTVAEGRQTVSGFTTGISGARNSTEFTFTLATATDIAFDFVGLAEIYVELHQDLVQAQSSYSWNLSIVEIGVGEVLNWSPDGTGTITCSGTATNCSAVEPFSLNDAHSVLSAGSDGTGGVQNGLFQGLLTLAGQTDYRLTIAHGSQINTEAVKVQVPEPGILFLLGAGLAGLGFTRRRNKA